MLGQDTSFRAKAATLKIELCSFAVKHDHASYRCNAVATHVVHWRNGKTSPVCRLHPVQNLDADTKSLVDAFEPIT